MKSIKIILIAVCCVLLTTACDDYLDFEYPGQTLAIDAFRTPNDAVMSITAAYAPMTTEVYHGTYIYEWWIGDVCSDDAIKGGDNGVNAMPTVFDLENFRTRSDNDLLHRYYGAQYIGAFRTNFVLENVSQMDPALFEAGLQGRIIGEAHFLRAFYHFRLVRMFGGVAKADRIIRIINEWRQPRNSEDEVYDFVEDDLLRAIALLPDQGNKLVQGADLGRATKGAARALLMKVYMNRGKFAEAKAQGDSIISIDPYRYQLLADFNQNFDFTFENNRESLFEIQYFDNGQGDWQSGPSNGMGNTRASWTTIMTRPPWGFNKEQQDAIEQGISETSADYPKGVANGWAWNRPVPELYDEFEPGDMRRDATIINPSEKFFPFEGDTETTPNTYLGIRYYSRKYSMMLPDTTFTLLDSNNPRGTLNHKEIRYSDVLLMYAEACVKSPTPDLNQAKWALEQVRARARAFSGGGNVLPPFPNYSIPMRGVGIAGTKQLQDNPEDLYLAIQHERRVELAMEGHRWFDLKRWGLLEKVMNHLRETTPQHIATYIEPFVAGKHEIFPIPLRARDLNPLLTQNPGYDGVPVK